MFPPCLCGSKPWHPARSVGERQPAMRSRLLITSLINKPGTELEETASTPSTWIRNTSVYPSETYSDGYEKIIQDWLCMEVRRLLGEQMQRGPWKGLPGAIQTLGRAFWWWPCDLIDKLPSVSWYGDFINSTTKSKRKIDLIKKKMLSPGTGSAEEHWGAGDRLRGGVRWWAHARHRKSHCIWETERYKNRV